MLSEEKSDWQNLCEECSAVAKKARLTKADTDRIIKESRETIEKANKYDSLVKKIKDKVIDYKKLEKSYRENNNQTMATYMYYQWAVLQELLEEAENGFHRY